MDAVIPAPSALVAFGLADFALASAARADALPFHRPEDRAGAGFHDPAPMAIWASH